MEKKALLKQDILLGKKLKLFNIELKKKLIKENKFFVSKFTLKIF